MKEIKLIFSLIFSFFYIPGYYFIYQELQKSEYEIGLVLIGLLFTLFGLLGHSFILFEDKWYEFEENKRYMRITKVFFKCFLTVLMLAFGLPNIYYAFNPKIDIYAYEDLQLFDGVLREKPEKRGSKSSLNIYLQEFPQYKFRPTHDSYIHHQTRFEAECNVGDTITLGILRDSYEKSIIKTKTKSYYEKHVNAQFISVFHIQKGEKITTTLIHTINWS